MQFIGIEGQSPLKIEHALNYNIDVHSNWVVPVFSSVVYRIEVRNLRYLIENNSLAGIL